MAMVGRLSRLPLLIGGELRRTFGRHGLDPASFDVLATLRRSGSVRPLTPAELMRASMVTSGAITQRLDRLENRGLVTRSPCPRDARVVHVTLTAQGRVVVDRALPDHVATMDRLLSGLTPEQRDAATHVLRVLLESLGDTGEGIRGHSC